MLSCERSEQTSAPPPALSVDAGSNAPDASASALTPVLSSPPPPGASSRWSEIKRIDAMAPTTRTIDDIMSLARTHRELAQGEPAGWLRDARLDPVAAADPTALRRLWQAIEDPAVSLEAADAAARWPSHHGVDILYAWASAAHPPPGTQPMLDDLLSTDQVRSRASPALQVALDLRLARTCFEKREVLPRAVEHGDQRAADQLAPLLVRTGCGDDDKADCFACMRTDDWLDKAIDRAKKRSAPTPWAVSRPAAK